MKPTKSTLQDAALWHPNFRVEASLPDTKVIRTSFMVNAAAVALVLATSAVLVSREQATAGLFEQASGWTDRIQAMPPAYTEAVTFQKNFSAGEKRVKEIDAFVTADHVASLYLRRVAETLPRYFTLDSVEMDARAVLVRGTIVGTAVKVPDIATAYVKQLESDPFFSAQIESVKLSSLDPEKDMERMIFLIEMKLKARK